MSRLFEYDTLQEGYADLVSSIANLGRRRNPRGQATSEIENATVVIRDPSRAWPNGINRKYGRAIAAAEAMCLVGGVGDPQLMCEVGANFKRFLDGGQLHGAYGPRVRAQMENVCEKLRDDPDTRQAIVQVWDARYDMAGWTPKDLPCTLSFGFAIFDGKLEMTTTMRSNDVWWGVAHDFPMFTCLQQTVASAIGRDVGPYTHQAYSLHLYDRDLEAFEALRAPVEPPMIVRGLYAAGGWEQGAERARTILRGETPPNPTPSEAFYLGQLAPHVHSLQSEGRLEAPK